MKIPDEMRVQPNINFNLNPALNFNLLLISIITILMMAGQASAIDVAKQWYPENQTIKIYNSLNEITWATIRLVSVNPDIDRITKEYNVTAYVNYTISNIDSFKYAFRIEKGKNGITKQEWYILKAVPYVVNDYGINSTWRSKEVYNNQTGLNETIWYWDNQTVVIGNHTEYSNQYQQFNPVNGISMVKGKSYYFRQVLFKKAELGDVRIQTNVTFLGLTENNMTWWNTSWSKKAPILINNTGNDTGLTNYQVNLNVTYDTDMQIDGSDLRVANDTSGLTEPYWKDENNSVNSSHFNIWFNASSLAGSAWTNTSSLYYGNPSAASASNETNVFELYGNTQTTEVDPNNRYTLTNSTSTAISGVARNENAYIYKNISTISDFRYDFDLSITDWGAEGGWTCFGGFADTIGAATSVTNGLYACSIGTGLHASHYTSGAPASSTAIAYTLPFQGYARFERIGTEVTLSMFSNKERTNPISGSPVTYTDSVPVVFNKAYVAASHNDADGRSLTGTVANNIVRKYASPEPTASLGAEESVALARVQVIIIS